jgi:hypothetical protein
VGTEEMGFGRIVGNSEISEAAGQLVKNRHYTH